MYLDKNSWGMNDSVFAAEVNVDYWKTVKKKKSPSAYVTCLSSDSKMNGISTVLDTLLP